MNEKEAHEILKHFEPHKVIPFTWLQRDLDGNPTALACAEAVGFFAGIESERKRAGELVGALKKISITNGLQYSDIFRICDKALVDYQGTAGDEEGDLHGRKQENEQNLRKYRQI